MTFLASFAVAFLFGCMVGALGFFLNEAVQSIKGRDVATGETKH